MQTLFRIFLSILGVVFLQELPSFISEKLFDKAIPSLFKLAAERMRKHYYRTLTDKSFREFKTKILSKYYSEEGFTKINGRVFPVCIFPYIGGTCNTIDDDRRRWTGKYDNIINNKDVDDFSIEISEHQTYKRFPCYHIYRVIMGGKIHYPDRPCFMLKTLETNEMNEMTSLSVSIGTYGENTYSNHVLEYELYRIYNKYKGKDIEKEWSSIRKKMVLRNAKQHNRESNIRTFLCNAEGRFSMLAVQMLVLIRSNNTFKVMIIQRANTVAVASNFYQLVPAGAFEIYNDSKPEYAVFEIKANLSPGVAIFREYLEEILGNPEFEGLTHGSVSETLAGDEHIQEISRLLDEKKAVFRFLGSVADLTYLRHYLSFVLVISDPEYRRNTVFPGNDEAMNNAFVDQITIDNFENNDTLWDNLFGPSAGMWSLFKHHLEKDDELRKFIKINK